MSNRMSPNLNPKTLDDLLANARHYAEYCMRGTGNLPPTLFLVGSNGKQVMFMPQNLPDAKAKDNFAQMSKLMAIACGATVAAAGPVALVWAVSLRLAVARFGRVPGLLARRRIPVARAWPVRVGRAAI